MRFESPESLFSENVDANMIFVNDPRRSSTFVPLVAEFGGKDSHQWTNWQKLKMILFIPQFVCFLTARMMLMFWTRHINSVGKFIFGIISFMLLLIGIILLISVRVVNIFLQMIRFSIQKLSYTDYESSMYDKYYRATDYREFQKYGHTLDSRSLMLRKWKSQMHSRHYNSEKLLQTMKQMKELRKQHDKEYMMNLLLNCCQRQFCEIDNESLYYTLHYGTKDIIAE